jgi:parallel beta-helix repeat protein
MDDGFFTYLVAKNRRNNLKWRVPFAILGGIALLFASQGFSRAADESHDAIAITACDTVINNAGLYFLANDLKQCDNAITIAVSDVKLELRGHTMQGVLANPLAFADYIIKAQGGTTGLSNIEIAGPGTVTGGLAGIDFENVHRSRVHNLVVVGNDDGIDVIAGVPSTDPNFAATASTDNEFRDNVVTANFFNGIYVNGGNENRFIHNNLGGNASDGLFLLNANHNVARQNTADANGQNGIEIGTLGSGNTVEDNTALGNAVQTLADVDLVDQNGNCTQNHWTGNSFNFNFPSCIQ